MEKKIALKFYITNGGFVATEIDEKGNDVFLGKERIYSTESRSFKEAMLYALVDFAERIVPEHYIMHNNEKDCDTVIAKAEIKLICE